MDKHAPGRTILVVEDESIIAMDITASLRRLGYETTATAVNGAEALELTEKFKPDLILIDILLRGNIDGIDTAIAIKEKFNIPFVYLTANTDELTFQRAKNSGPFGYLLKPFEEQELHSTIETAIFKHQAEQELKRHLEQLEELVQKRTAELEKSHTILHQLETNYRTIFNNTNDAIFVFDADTRILDANPKASELTGYPLDEIQKHSFSDISGSEQPLSPKQAENLIHKTLSGKPQVFEWIIKNTDGSRNWVEFSINNVTINDNNLLLAVARNISMRKESEQILIKAKEEAEKANQLKNEFLSNMSHEIRTPMNAVIGMTKITLSTDLNAEQRSYLEMILESASSLLDLLNNVLDYSKIDAGQVILASQPFVLSQLIESTARSVDGRAKAKGLEIKSIAPSPPCSLIGDSQRVRQIIHTLLDNAIKFTKKGGVQIKADQLENSGDELIIEIAVSDTGAGIPKNKQDQIFDLFTQADGSYTRSHNGAGLGLAVIHKLVRLLNGNIRVESEEGQGSTFFVQIPFKKGPAQN